MTPVPSPLVVVLDVTDAEMLVVIRYPEIDDDGKRTGKVDELSVSAGEVATWAGQYNYQKGHGE